MQGRAVGVNEGGWAHCPPACHRPPFYQIMLLPRVMELPGLRSVDPGATGYLQELHKAGCMEAAKMSLSSSMIEACARLVCSISALLHGGGLCECAPGLQELQERGYRRHHEVHLILPFLLPVCECHPQGSLSTKCALLGGKCPCCPNVVGRTCDHCPEHMALVLLAAVVNLQHQWVWVWALGLTISFFCMA